MPAFFLALIAAAFAGFGGRDYRLVAHLSAAFNGSAMVLVLGIVSSVVTAGIAAFGGSLIAEMVGGDASLMLAALALVWAGVEMAWPWRRALPKEPTRSAFAILIVLLAAQVGDAARFLILAVAVATASPVLAMAGGAFGGCMALTLAWSGEGRAFSAIRVRQVRLYLGCALALLGIVMGMMARGIV